MGMQQNNQVPLVTGATSGMGIDIAKQLTQDGFRVVISGRSVERGERVAAELGETARFLQADLLTPGAPSALVEATVAEMGRLDVLVNNAAIDHTNDLLDVGEGEIARRSKQTPLRQ